MENVRASLVLLIVHQIFPGNVSCAISMSVADTTAGRIRPPEFQDTIPDSKKICQYRILKSPNSFYISARYMYNNHICNHDI